MKYRLPAEWENHNSVLIMIPYNGYEFPDKFAPVSWAFIEYIKKIAYTENVTLLVKDDKHKATVEKRLVDSDVNMQNVSLTVYAAKRAWMRDSGPITVFDENNQPVILDFKFNAWANYTPHECDDLIAPFIAELRKQKLIQPVYKGKRVVLEGGAIDTNGLGTLLCTEECLMDAKDQVRNQGFSKDDYFNVFNEYFGISNLIWLYGGVTGDDTHGHVDDICRFVNEDTVVACVEQNADDINYAPLQENIKRLKAARLENGKPFNIVELPMPKAISYQGVRLPATYANFLITPESVLVPVYNDESDRKALSILADLFPTRKIIGICAVDIVWGRGGLHCLSHELY